MLNKVQGNFLMRISGKNVLKGKLPILQKMAVKNRLPWKRACHITFKMLPDKFSEKSVNLVVIALTVLKLFNFNFCRASKVPPPPPGSE